jgi:hypothetical protein
MFVMFRYVLFLYNNAAMVKCIFHETAAIALLNGTQGGRRSWFGTEGSPFGQGRRAGRDMFR